MTQDVIIAVISSGAFFTFIQYLITRHDKKDDESDTRYKELKDGLEKHDEMIKKLNEILVETRKENDGIKQLLIGIGHDKLVFMTDKIARRQAITLKEKATLDAIFVPYSSLGGNGDGEAGYKYCITLPVVSDEGAREKDNSLLCEDMGIKNNKEVHYYEQ